MWGPHGNDCPTQAMREYFRSVLSIAEVLLRSSQPVITQFACAVYRCAFVGFDAYCRQVWFARVPPSPWQSLSLEVVKLRPWKYLKVKVEKSWKMFTLVWKILLHNNGQLTSATGNFCCIAIQLISYLHLHCVSKKTTMTFYAITSMHINRFWQLFAEMLLNEYAIKW